MWVVSRSFRRCVSTRLERGASSRVGELVFFFKKKKRRDGDADHRAPETPLPLPGGVKYSTDGEDA